MGKKRHFAMEKYKTSCISRSIHGLLEGVLKNVTIKDTTQQIML
jgi:hypothetical protein